MKKILMLSVFCGIVMLAGGASFASPTYGTVIDVNSEINSVGKGLSGTSSDEKGCQPLSCDISSGNDNLNAETLKIGNAGANSCYICESDYCKDGETVFDLDTEIFMVCRYGFDDTWEKYKPSLCKGKTDYANFYAKGDSGLEKVWVVDGQEHKAGQASGNNTMVYENGRSICYYYRCIGGLNFVFEKGKCVSTGVEPQEIVCTNGGDKAHALGSSCGNDEEHICTDSQGSKCVCGKCVKKTQETKTCEKGSDKILSQSDCKTGTTFSCEKKNEKGNCVCGACVQTVEDGGESGVVGKCHPSVCVSEVCKACCAKPSSETVWDRSEQVCQCMNGGNFTKENNQWICKVDSSQVAGPKEDCDPTLLAKVKDWALQCSPYLEKPGANEVVSELARILEYCKGQNVKNDVFLRLYDDLKEMVDRVCVESTVVPQPVEDNNAALIIEMRKRITSAADVLDSIRSGFKVSVWKDEKGNFNTSRLVSDSVAGVVLGTAGGLITSNVVKKNQIEDGFEDIQCTVGGQVISNWGDEFRVGIQ